MKDLKMLIWVSIFGTSTLCSCTTDNQIDYNLISAIGSITGGLAAIGAVYYAHRAFKQADKTARNSQRPLLRVVIKNQITENVVTGLKVILASRGVGPAILTQSSFHYNGEDRNHPSECLLLIEDSLNVSFGNTLRLNFNNPGDTIISVEEPLTIFDIDENQGAILPEGLTHLQLRNIVRNEISFEIRYESVYGDSFDLNRLPNTSSPTKS